MNYSLIKQLSKGKFFIYHATAMNEVIPVFNALNGGSYMARPETLGIKLYNDKAEESINNKDSKIEQDSIAMIPLHGSMLKNGTLCSYGTSEIASMMLEIAKEKNVTGIILDIDSGGGAVDSVAPLVDVIKKIQSDFNKPVVALCDLCASAAYWVACACDKIIASNNISAEFGSIGVMMSFMDVKPFYEKQGYVFHEIYSNLSTEKNDTFRKALNGEYEKIKTEELDPLALQFRQSVLKLRNGKFIADTDEANLKGKTYFADKAKELGMIDIIGNADVAIAEIKRLSNKYIINNYLNN